MLSFLFSLYVLVPALVLFAIVAAFALDDNSDPSYGWATTILAVSIGLVQLKWHLPWLLIATYAGYALAIGLLYMMLKWIWEVKKYHLSVIERLKDVKYPATNIQIRTKSSVGQRYLMDTYDSYEDVMRLAVPQFSENKARATSWVIFWPFYILADIAPLKWISNIVDLFGNLNQKIANAIFKA